MTDNNNGDLSKVYQQIIQQQTTTTAKQPNVVTPILGTKLVMDSQEVFPKEPFRTVIGSRKVTLNEKAEE